MLAARTGSAAWCDTSLPRHGSGTDLKAEKPTPILLHSEPSSVTMPRSNSIHSAGRSCDTLDRAGISSIWEVSTGNARYGMRSPVSCADTRPLVVDAAGRLGLSVTCDTGGSASGAPPAWVVLPPACAADASTVTVMSKSTMDCCTVYTSHLHSSRCAMRAPAGQ